MKKNSNPDKSNKQNDSKNMHSNNSNRNTKKQKEEISRFLKLMMAAHKPG